MAKAITATEIKANVMRTLKAYRRKLNDPEMPYYFNEATSRMAIDEARAYLSDARFTCTDRTKQAIENWCNNIKFC